MRYEDFKTLFMATLCDSGLYPIGAEGVETLDLRTTDRTFTVYVEGPRPRQASPFHVTGEISWRWDALQTARTATTEEDMLVQLLGREMADGVETERPWLRVDLRIRAGLMPDASMPFPTAASWARWRRELSVRSNGKPTLITDGVTRKAGAQVAVLSWQGDPEVTAKMTPSSELLLDSIRLAAFQGIDLPRRWDDPDRAVEEGPERQLRAMLEGVKRTLAGWGEALEFFE